MNDYFKNLNETIKQYFYILSDEIPQFLCEYIATPEMQKQKSIDITCGNFYTKLFNTKLWYSSLDHSVAVALIIWHFTKDKKQTLSGLFHDIATPVFKHCIDFMNGDYETQESTEKLTSEIIKGSKEIMSLLNRDGITVEEVSDYHIYPIADNNTPQLSADRLEYTFSNGLGVRKDFLDLNEVQELYQNIEIQKNEDGVEELGFKDKKLAEKFVNTAIKLQTLDYISNRTLLSMQFLADLMKEMSEKKLITKRDLYTLSEKDVINMIENCEDKNISECFNLWKNTTQIGESDTPISDKYCKSIKGKLRYIVPLVRCENEYIRINKISDVARQDIENCLNYETKKYAYFDFNF